MKSITDDEVKRVFDKEAIITGGAIASLLLGEDVNDFDYYFTSKEACLKVATYYIEKFKKESKLGEKVQPSVIDEGDRIRIRIEGVSDAQGHLEEMQSRDIAGDVTEADTMDSMSMVKAQPDNKKPYRVVFMTSNAITLSDKVQLVMRFHGDADEIHKNYDFAHCTNYWKAEDGIVHLRPEAMESLLSKHLHYQGSLYPVCSIIRTRKFIKRGWHINAGQYLKMAFQVSELDLNDISVLNEQLIGVDTAYFQQLIDIIKQERLDNSEFSIDSHCISSIIDKIF
jgi:hypothetical protein